MRMSMQNEYDIPIKRVLGIDFLMPSLNAIGIHYSNRWTCVRVIIWSQLLITLPIILSAAVDRRTFAFGLFFFFQFGRTLVRKTPRNLLSYRFKTFKWTSKFTWNRMFAHKKTQMLIKSRANGHTLNIFMILVKYCSLYRISALIEFQINNIIIIFFRKKVTAHASGTIDFIWFLLTFISILR